MLWKTIIPHTKYNRVERIEDHFIGSYLKLVFGQL